MKECCLRKDSRGACLQRNAQAGLQQHPARAPVAGIALRLQHMVPSGPSRADSLICFTQDGHGVADRALFYWCAQQMLLLSRPKRLRVAALKMQTGQRQHSMRMPRCVSNTFLSHTMPSCAAMIECAQCSPRASWKE